MRVEVRCPACRTELRSDETVCWRCGSRDLVVSTPGARMPLADFMAANAKAFGNAGAVIPGPAHGMAPSKGVVSPAPIQQVRLMFDRSTGQLEVRDEASGALIECSDARILVAAYHPLAVELQIPVSRIETR